MARRHATPGNASDGAAAARCSADGNAAAAGNADGNAAGNPAAVMIPARLLASTGACMMLQFLV